MENFLYGIGCLCGYFLILATIAIALRKLVKIPDEIFRKFLHFILLGSLIVWVTAFDKWWTAALTAIVLEILIYPVLAFAERFKTYSETVTERKKGELKSSLLYVFTTFAAVISVCWGGLGDRYLVVASVYAWGVGDAFAALVGKKFGKHKIRLPRADQNKSWEGTSSAFITSAISVAVVLTLRGGLSPAAIAVTSLATALVASIAELYSKNGMDTVVCPLASTATLTALLFAFGGLAL